MEWTPGLVEFEVADASAPRADVFENVPVEAEVRNADPPRELLLHVMRGLLDCLDLVTDEDSEPTELPDPAELDPPFVHLPAG